MLTKLKKQVQRALASQAVAAHKIGLTPNGISAAGFILSFLAAVAFALTSSSQLLWLLLAVGLMVASGYCDALDGVLARTYHQVTAFGGFFDSMLDRFADAFVLGGIIFSGVANGAEMNISHSFTLAVGLVALISSFSVSYSRARAEILGVKMESVGIAERAERIIILVAASIVGFFWLPAIIMGLLLIAILASITVIQRVIHTYRTLKAQKS